KNWKKIIFEHRAMLTKASFNVGKYRILIVRKGRILAPFLQGRDQFRTQRNCSVSGPRLGPLAVFDAILVQPRIDSDFAISEIDLSPTKRVHLPGSDSGRCGKFDLE